MSCQSRPGWSRSSVTSATGWSSCSQTCATWSLPVAWMAAQEESALRAPLTRAEQLHLATHLSCSTVLRRQLSLQHIRTSIRCDTVKCVPVAATHGARHAMLPGMLCCQACYAAPPPSPPTPLLSSSPSSPPPPSPSSPHGHHIEMCL